MFNSFPYDEWSDSVTDFWTWGGANSTGTYIMTVLGASSWSPRSSAGCGSRSRSSSDRRRCSAPPAPSTCQPHPRRPTREEETWSKQIDFDPLQKEVSWLAPFMIVLSLLCTVIVTVVLLTDADGAFIGPWG